MIKTTFPSPSIRIKAFRIELSALSPLLSPNGKLRLNAMPPPGAALMIKCLRRRKWCSNPWGRWWIMISRQLDQCDSTGLYQSSASPSFGENLNAAFRVTLKTPADR